MIALLKLLGLVFLVVCIIAVIVGITQSDGKCHGDCKTCPYCGTCPQQEEKDDDKRKR
jgi:hypothetical protein